MTTQADLYRLGAVDVPEEHTALDRFEEADELAFEFFDFMETSPDMKVLKWGIDFLENGPTLTIGDSDGEK